MRRRAFLTLIGGAAAWPLAVGAQQGERMRRIGILTSLVIDDRETQARNEAFLLSLRQLGWIDGNNVQFEVRGTRGEDDIRQHVAELVALAPDVILSSGTVVTGPLIQATRTVPIVFVQVVDPVGAGFVTSLRRPGGNATGFSLADH